MDLSPSVKTHMYQDIFKLSPTEVQNVYNELGDYEEGKALYDEPLETTKDIIEVKKDKYKGQYWTKSKWVYGYGVTVCLRSGGDTY